MPVPKKKLTRTRQGNRRSHLALKAKKLVKCPNCQTLILPHRQCYNCGNLK